MMTLERIRCSVNAHSGYITHATHRQRTQCVVGAQVKFAHCLEIRLHPVGTGSLPLIQTAPWDGCPLVTSPFDRLLNPSLEKINIFEKVPCSFHLPVVLKPQEVPHLQEPCKQEAASLQQNNAVASWAG